MRVRPPDDALVQVGHAYAVVFVVKRKQELILRFGHVVDAPRIGRVKNLLLHPFTGFGHDLDVQVALRNFHPGRCRNRTPPIRTEVRDMYVESRLDDRAEDVVRRADVVVYGVAFMPRRLHRIRRGPLLGKVHDSVGAFNLQNA